MASGDIIKRKAWLEKYRVDSVDKIIGQPLAKTILAPLLQTEETMLNFPHLLIFGPAGTGKTTIANAIGHDILGPLFKGNFYELNASDERGIDVVRNNIKKKAGQKTMGNAPFKIILLDEADQLTSDAQGALRRTMERYQNNCVFILTCNYPSKIIEPIQSRCKVIPFRTLTFEEQSQLIDTIAENEGLTITDAAKEILIAGAEGDCRKVINDLQIAAQMSSEITPESITIATNTPDLKRAKHFMDLALSGDVKEARDGVVSEFINQGMDARGIVKSLERVVLNKDNYPDLHKITFNKIYTALGECDVNILQGANPPLQIGRFFSEVSTYSSIPVHCDGCK